MYVPEIIGLRPMESNSGAEQDRPQQVSGGERDQVVRGVGRGHVEERAQQGRVAEQDRVVEKRLPDEQAQAEHEALRVVADDRARDLPQADRGALPHSDRILVRLRQLGTGRFADLALDVTRDLLGLVLVAVDEQPAGALGDVPADDQDRESEDEAQPEADPPAEQRREDVQRRDR